MSFSTGLARLCAAAPIARSLVCCASTCSALFCCVSLLMLTLPVVVHLSRQISGVFVCENTGHSTAHPGFSNVSPGSAVIGNEQAVTAAMPVPCVCVSRCVCSLCVQHLFMAWHLLLVWTHLAFITDHLSPFTLSSWQLTECLRSLLDYCIMSGWAGRVHRMLHLSCWQGIEYTQLLHGDRRLGSFRG